MVHRWKCKVDERTAYSNTGFKWFIDESIRVFQVNPMIILIGSAVFELAVLILCSIFIPMWIKNQIAYSNTNFINESARVFWENSVIILSEYAVLPFNTDFTWFINERARGWWVNHVIILFDLAVLILLSLFIPMGIMN